MKNKYYLLIIIVLAFFTLGATNNRYKNPSTEEMKQEKTYVISTCVHTMGKDIWVFETKMNAKTGKIISRKQVHSKKYKNIK